MLKAIKINPHALKYASHELKNSKEIVYAAIKRSSNVLQYASLDL